MELRIEGVTKNYGNKCVLKNFNTEFTIGINAVLGPNGAGKSTLMNLITDNTARDAGSILFCGTEILTLGKEFRKILGFMPQMQGFYEEMTPFSFLAYIASLKCIPRQQAKSQIYELLEVVNLLQEAHRPIKSLSGGMRQRVMLSQALLGNPQVLILDEPTAGLDPEERVRLRQYINDLGKHIIVIISTHIASDVENMADRILIMKQGESLFCGAQNKLKIVTNKNSIEDSYIELMHKGENICEN